ncbi:hypothetical protein KFK09_018863 [Dendrobium nobile]|uniref:Uncharacterized protein n=1 Tax=Dendrobium nobile TaxID=94219 RepID=A0A8T3AWZ2_DENNO|nr:hypothetical protein KFK09_018863 [Dendrobium nobile]
MRMGTRWMDLSDFMFGRIGFSVLISSAEVDAVESAAGENPLFRFSSLLTTLLPPWISSLELGDPSDCLCISEMKSGT